MVMRCRDLHDDQYALRKATATIFKKNLWDAVYLDNIKLPSLFGDSFKPDQCKKLAQ